MAVRRETLSLSEINVSIVKVTDNTNRHEDIYSKISDELSDFKNDNVQQTIQGISESDSTRTTTTERSDRWRREYTGNARISKSQDYFQDNNALGKRYITTHIKSRNFLCDIAYVGINKEDYYNENFVFDVYLLITKNLNSFSLDRKLADKTKHEMMYMLWKKCMPQKFYKHICKEKHFLYMNGKNVLQPKVLEIITDFLSEDENNHRKLRNNLSSYKSIFQCVFSNLFPEIYCSTEKRGFDLISKVRWVKP